MHTFQTEGRAGARPQGGDELELFKGQQSHCSCSGVMEWYCRRRAQGRRKNVPGSQGIGETLDFVVRREAMENSIFKRTWLGPAGVAQ